MPASQDPLANRASIGGNYFSRVLARQPGTREAASWKMNKPRREAPFIVLNLAQALNKELKKGRDGEVIFLLANLVTSRIGDRRNAR